MEKKSDLVFPWKVGNMLEVVKFTEWDFAVCRDSPIGIVRKGDVITVTKIGKADYLSTPFAATFNGKEYGFSYNPSNEYKLVDTKCETVQTKHRIYIAGKITGLCYGNVQRTFGKAKELIEQWGFEPVSPLDHNDESKSWVENMLILLPILNTCDGIYLLDNWEESDGAKIEQKFAEKKGMFLIREVVR